ncbi:phage tail tape measure protein [Mitsuokella sp.]|uniref:phage tail tape measure protein n=1 Tax=Mitsuokella sp. TaxID=2049034 RepID=UPI002A835A66|nr:phage tail tape measure protein [Mitsuokella sp.]MDY4474050.1 phage tail tape measure protein [Mitsuokella sp.]
MADKEQLVYEINIIANGTDKIEGVKKSLEEAKGNLEKLNNTNLKIGVNGDFESKMHTLTRDLHEVKRAIELMNKGASINISGIPQTEQSLRSLEKTLEDTLKNIKAGSFNNLVQDMAKIQEAAIKDNEAIDKLLKKYDQLTRSLIIARNNNKLIPESTWYNRRDALDAVVAKLKEYGIIRDNIYRGQSYSTHKNDTLDVIDSLKRRAEIESQIEKIITRQAIAMERGQQVKRADFELSMKQFNQLLAEYQKLGGTKTFTSPFSSFKNAEEQNKSVMQKNAEAWATGLRTYSQELSRLMALQEQMYIIWRHDGSQEARENLNRLAASIAKVRAEQEAYQRVVNATKNPAPTPQESTSTPAQPVDPTNKWAEGIQSYVRELRRLEETQQKVYALWKSDPSEANKIALDNVKASLESVRKEYDSFQKSINKAGANINNTSNAFTSFEHKLRSHLYWITAGSLLDAAFAIPTETINALVMTDEEMHNLATVMPQLEGKSTEAIKKYQEEQRQLIATSSQYGESVKDVMESARLWGRMYKDQATVNTLVSQSAKLAVADNFSMAESTKAVEAAMFQFGMVAKNSTEALAYSNKIVDVYTKLSHNAGVSAQDLASGVERSGAVAKQAGMSFEFLTALIAQGTRATALSGSEIGNMLKTMLASFNSTKAVKELNKLGIATTEVVNGVTKVRSAQAVLMDVAVAAQATDKNLKDLWIQMSGGKFQWSKAAAMFSNYQEIIKNWGLAVNSMGFTDEQVKNQMDSISRRLKKLKADLIGMVTQAGNGGLTESIKNIISVVDRIIRGLNSISAGTYNAIGTFARLAAEMYVLNRAITAINTSLATTRAGLIKTGTEGAASMSTLRVAVEGVGMAFKRILPVLIATTVVEGILHLVGSLDDETDAIHKQSDALEENLAVKRQEIETYNRQEEFLDALFTAHQKLTAEIESSTVSDEKKKKLLEDRIETENQMANIVGWSAVQQMQADNWTENSTKQVRDEYKKATEDKKKALAQFIAAKQEEAVINYQTATKNMENWKQETHEFCLGMSDRIKSISDYTTALGIAYAAMAKFDEHRSAALDSRIEELEGKKQKLADLAKDPDYKWTDLDSQDYNDIADQIDSAKAEQGKVNKDLYNHRYNAEFYESGKAIMDKYNDAKSVFENLGDSALTNPGGSIDPNDLLQKWGSGEGAGGDVYNGVNSGDNGKQSHATGNKTHHEKQLWNYSDEASQSMSNIVEQMKYYGLEGQKISVANLEEIAAKLTGNTSMSFDNNTDIFRNGGANVWDSAYTFSEQLRAAIRKTGDFAHALNAMYSDISLDEWNTVLGNDTDAINKEIDFSKNRRKHYADPNENLNVNGDTDNFIMQLAEQVGKQWNANPNLIYAQWAHETANFTSKLFNNSNNMGGIKGMDGNYMSFESLESFAQYYSDKWGSTIAGTWSPEDFTQNLKNENYFTDDISNYLAGIYGALKNLPSDIGESVAGSLGDNIIEDAESMVGTTGAGSSGWIAANVSPSDSGYWGDSNGDWENQCASWVSYIMQKHGIKSIKSANGDVIMSQAGSAYHEGEAPLHAGDIINWAKHVGIYDGNGGYIARNSNGGVHHGTMDEAQSYFGNVIGYVDINQLAKDNGVSASSFRKASRWRSTDGDSYDSFERNEVKEYEKKVELAQKSYERTKKLIELNEKLYGKTAVLIEQANSNEDKRIQTLESAADFYADKIDEAKTTIASYIDGDAGLKGKVGSKETFLSLPSDEQSKLADISKDSSFKNAVQMLNEAKNKYFETNTNLQESQYDQKARNGYMSIPDSIDYALGESENEYTHNTRGLTEYETWSIDQAYYMDRLALLEKKSKFYEDQLDKLRDDDEKKLQEIQQQIDEAIHGKTDEDGNVIENGLDQFRESGDVNAIMKQTMKVNELTESYNQLKQNHSQDYREMQKNVDDVNKAIDETKEKLYEVEKGLHETIESGIATMFQNIFLEGKSFAESWKDLWKDIGKYAWEQLMKITVMPAINQWMQNIGTAVGGRHNYDRNGWGGSTLIGTAVNYFPNRNRLQTPINPMNRTGVSSGNRYLDMSRGVVNGNFFPMNNSSTKLTKAINDSVQKTSTLSSITQKATTLTNVSNTLTQTSNVKDTMNTAAVQANTVTGQTNTLQMQALTEAILMAKPTSGFSNGGSIPGYANAGLIRGAGTGKSDSILAYLANKDKFVYLSNGEYVMTAEATSRIGKDNLDAMNYGNFADGGVLSPTPYVPQISPRVAKRAEGVHVTNPNARMEQLMQEQTDTIKNMSNSDTSGNVVVLNTHASSDDVMNAIQRNPRAFQSILHNQKRHGFR